MLPSILSVRIRVQRTLPCIPTMYCSNCGKEWVDSPEYKKCWKCGNKAGPPQALKPVKKEAYHDLPDDSDDEIKEGSSDLWLKEAVRRGKIPPHEVGGFTTNISKEVKKQAQQEKIRKEAKQEREKKIKRDANNKKERQDGVQSAFGHDPRNEKATV
jgi:hypothetical protein